MEKVFALLLLLEGIFYGKQPPFNRLVYLGKLRGDGVEILKTIKGDFEAKITK